MFGSLMIVLGLVVLAILMFLAYAAFKSGDFRIERSLSIDAPPDRIFPLINDLHNFNRWNPFALSDPQSLITYRGAATGVGAAYDWNSSGRSGSGCMEITNSAPASKVTMSLQFTKPFTATNVAEFTLVPAGRATNVTWAMTGCSAFLHRLMSMIFNMDKMVGGEFAKGHANLKAIAEEPGF